MIGYMLTDEERLWTAYCLGKRAAGTDLDPPFSNRLFNAAWTRGKKDGETP